MGKKFDAHKKHFEEKELKLRQQLRNMQIWVDEISNTNIQLVKDNERLKKEHDIMKETYEKMLELSKLSNEEIQSLLCASKLKLDCYNILKTSRFLNFM